MTHGLRAKTNFSYTKSQIESILEKEKDEPFLDESIESQKEQKTNDEDYAPSLNVLSNTVELLKQDKSSSKDVNDIIKSEEQSPQNYKNSNQIIF